MLNKFRDNLVYIGSFILLAALLVKYLFSIDAGVIHFFVGFGCALQLVGAVVLITKKKSA